MDEFSIFFLHLPLIFIINSTSIFHTDDSQPIIKNSSLRGRSLS